MKKRKTRLRGTKTAAKSEQKKLRKRLDKIKERPELLLPRTKEGTTANDIYAKVLRDLKLAKEQYLNPPRFFSGILKINFLILLQKSKPSILHGPSSSEVWSLSWLNGILRISNMRSKTAWDFLICVFLVLINF